MLRKRVHNDDKIDDKSKMCLKKNQTFRTDFGLKTENINFTLHKMGDKRSNKEMLQYQKALFLVLSWYQRGPLLAGYFKQWQIVVTGQC